LEMTGQPAPVIEDVTTQGTGRTQLAISDTGTVVYLPAGRGFGNGVPILWMTRDGKTAPLRPTPADWSNPAFAPAGRKLAIDIGDGNQLDVWVYEWARDTLTRLTINQASDLKPVWTPDGRRIVFTSLRDLKSGGQSVLAAR
jgi:Tol biopolymer transport system component